MTLDTRPPAAPAAPSTRLELLLSRIQDPALAEQLRQEMRSRDRREFGLVFEHHLPETVELPGLRIQPGRKVRILPERGTTKPADPTVWTVTEIDGLLAKLQTAPDPDHVETAWQRIENLVAVADFADPIYPGLKLTDKLECDRPGRPWHTLINAENYHALQALQYTHAGQIDTIYIDPPYNTGNDDWIYADRHVAAEDSFRHSKWLSFMERRLLLARALLKPTGVIIVAIGDDEHHRLRMLMDQVFGESNFLADITWQGRGKNDRRYTGGGADYMVTFARSRADLDAATARWVEPKPGASEMVHLSARVLAEAVQAGDDPESARQKAQGDLRAWMKAHSAELAGGLKQYNCVSVDGRVYRGGPLDWPGGGGPRYEVRHPVTGRSVPVPKAGWRAPEPTFWRWHAEGRVVWGKDESTIPQRMLFLDEQMEIVPLPSFTSDRDVAAKHVERILGDKRFPFPKDHTVLMRWIGMVTPSDGTVLDFFGGSGSTLEAVLRLNAQDGGSRQCILVTNNEVGSKAERDMRKRGLRDGDPEWEAAGVCEYVTKPRIRTILTGVRPDGSLYADTVPGNVAMYDLSYEDPLHVELDLAFERVAPMLWLAAGGKGCPVDVARSNDWVMSENYGVLFKVDAQRSFLAAVTSQRMFFVVTDDEGQFQQIAGHLPTNSRAVRLYESYLRTFQIQ